MVLRRQRRVFYRTGTRARMTGKGRTGDYQVETRQGWSPFRYGLTLILLSFQFYVVVRFILLYACGSWSRLRAKGGGGGGSDFFQGFFPLSLQSPAGRNGAGVCTAAYVFLRSTLHGTAQ